MLTHPPQAVSCAWREVAAKGRTPTEREAHCAHVWTNAENKKMMVVFGGGNGYVQFNTVELFDLGKFCAMMLMGDMGSWGLDYAQNLNNGQRCKAVELCLLLEQVCLFPYVFLQNFYDFLSFYTQHSALE